MTRERKPKYVAAFTANGKASAWDNPEEAYTALRVYQIQFIQGLNSEHWIEENKRAANMFAWAKAIPEGKEWEEAYFYDAEHFDWVIEYLNIKQYSFVFEAGDNEL